MILHAILIDFGSP